MEDAERSLMTTAHLTVDCSLALGRLERIWASIGYDELNWTYTPRGKALYRVLHSFAETPYTVRLHNALTSGNGLSSPASGSTNIFHLDENGQPFYTWDILDQIYDTITGADFRPLVEFGFLPLDLVPVEAAAADWLRDVGRETYEADGWWKYPPKDDALWAQLIEAFVRHVVERYGAPQVETWLFEVWNEPNLPNYWKGSLQDYCRLFDVTEAAARRVLPTIRLGGPASSSPGTSVYRDFLRGFLQHCACGTNYVSGQSGTRLDFISFHTKGAHYSRRRIYNPRQVVERESPSSAVMLGDLRSGLQTAAEFPQLRGIPVLVDECDPAVGTIYGVFDNPNFIVTNNEHYPVFAAALFRRILDLPQANNPIRLATTWAFYFEGKRFFEGNRSLVDNENIEKPILNLFRALARLGETRLQVHSDRRRDVLAESAPPDEVDGMAALCGKQVSALVWHQADAWWARGSACVEVVVENLPFTGRAQISHYRIDAAHSNAYSAWVQMGSPQDPSNLQLEQLRAKQGLELLAAPETLSVDENGKLKLTFEMPLQSLSLLLIEPAPPLSQRSTP